MATSIDCEDEDDLTRQRRKREARLLDQRVTERPELTIADLVADVLAACEGDGSLDVAGHLAVLGYGPETTAAVVGYVHRHYLPAGPVPTQLRLP